MAATQPVKILLFSPSAHGGIAEHTFYQARALEKLGAKVICLAPKNFLNGRETGFEKIVSLTPATTGGGNRLLRRFRIAWACVVDRWILAWQILKQKPAFVLLDSYVEYFAPFWVWPHWLLARFMGVTFAANLHDPVRSYVVGPEWWHKLSVRLAYLPLDFVLVHEKLQEPSPVPSSVRVAQVPHGLYEISGPKFEAATVRQEWGVGDGQKVFLSFGFVRDGKNLELAIRALAQVKDAFLVVAGSVASSHDKPFSFYRELAEKCGVANRCRFFEGFVPDTELGKYFAGTDFVLLTYAASFHSQSGVLHIAARARKPVLASAAPSGMIESVKRFSLGVTVAPDSSEAIVSGMKQLLEAPPIPRWKEYEASSAWEENARIVLQMATILGTRSPKS